MIILLKALSLFDARKKEQSFIADSETFVESCGWHEQWNHHSPPQEHNSDH